MCGIFGWFGKGERQDLDSMARSLRHRGPDDSGFFSSKNEQVDVSMGMTRLAVIDIDHGSQPFFSNDRSVVCVCNGTIYNYQSLKQELSQKGYQFQTNSDIEVIPSAYQEWGLGFLKRLNGMFAIALYDRNVGELFLARDRCGQKPLYYSTQGSKFLFASEMRALWSVGVKKKMNEAAIAEYLSLRYVCEPKTMFADVSTIPAGCVWRSSTQSYEPWWEVEFCCSKTSSCDIANVNSLHRAVRTAVSESLVSDVPMAVHLSAGVDSSLLLNEIVNVGAEVKAVTASFGDAADEEKEASAFSKRLGVDHTSVRLCEKDLLDLPRVISQMEVPVGDALIVAFDKLAKRTQEIGCKVALGGEGVDEVFAGYSFLTTMHRANSIGVIGRKMAASVLDFLPSEAVQKLSAFPASLGESGLEKVTHYLRGYNNLTDYQKGIELRTLFDLRELNRLGFPSFDGSSFDSIGGVSLIDRHLSYQFKGWLQDWAIIRQERNTMAHSVEYRMPFLDHRMIEVGMYAPLSALVNRKGGKYLWRAMAKEKYPEVGASRVKQPFYFPLENERYFNLFEKLVEDFLLAPDVRIAAYMEQKEVEALWVLAKKSREFIYMKQVMALVVLEMWIREHF